VAKSADRLLEFDSSGTSSRIPPSVTWDGHLSQAGSNGGGALVDPWSPKPTAGASGLDPWGMPVVQPGVASVGSSGFSDPWASPMTAPGQGR